MAKQNYTFALDTEVMEEMELVAAMRKLKKSVYVEMAIVKLTGEDLKKSQDTARNILNLYKADSLIAMKNKQPLPDVELYVELNKHIFVE